MAQSTNGNKDHDDRWEEIDIPVPWGQISGKWWGSRTQQPLIAIHGWQDNAGSFDNLAALLVEEKFSVYAIDFPGHGHSSHYPPGCTYSLTWDGVQVVRRIAKHFKWKKISIIGHSMGGAIAFLYAGVFPDDVANLICLDVAGAALVDNKRLLNMIADCIDKCFWFESSDYDVEFPYSYEDMIALVSDAYKGELTRESCEIIVKRGAKLTDDGQNYTFRRDPRVRFAATGMLSMEYTMLFASQIKCRVLNIRAMEGYNFVCYDEILDKIAETAAKMERHSIPGNHFVHLNDPDYISEIVTDFLKT